jgi:hypothetical protein
MMVTLSNVNVTVKVSIFTITVTITKEIGLMIKELEKVN